MPTMGLKWVGGGDRSGKAAVPSPVKSLNPLSDEPSSSSGGRSNGRDAPDDEGTTLGNEGKSSGAPISANRVDAPANIQKESKARKGYKTFEERLEELKAYKTEHGHLNVEESEGKSLYNFCKNTRSARKGLGKTKLTKERIASLNALGFVWEPQSRKANNSFHERVEALKAYKGKHGHLKVKESEDKSLYGFCESIRSVRRGIRKRKLTKERIASLDALGFEWEPQHKNSGAFERRMEELKAYKARHGHTNVKKSEDKSLATFCIDTRRARKNPESRKGRKLTADRIASLDALEFDWKMQKSKEKATEEREKAEAEVAARR